MESGQGSTRHARRCSDQSRHTRWLKRFAVLIVVGGGATVGFTLAAEPAVAGPARLGDRPNLVDTVTAVIDETVADVSGPAHIGVGDGRVPQVVRPTADAEPADAGPAGSEPADAGAAPVDIPHASPVTGSKPAAGPAGTRHAVHRHGTDPVRPTDGRDRVEDGITHQPDRVTPVPLPSAPTTSLAIEDTSAVRQMVPLSTTPHTIGGRIGSSIRSVGCGLTAVAGEVRSVPHELRSVVHAVAAALRLGPPSAPPHPSNVVSPSEHPPATPTVPEPAGPVTRPSPVRAQLRSAPAAAPSPTRMTAPQPGAALGAGPQLPYAAADGPTGTAVGDSTGPGSTPPTRTRAPRVRAGTAGPTDGDPPPLLVPAWAGPSAGCRVAAGATGSALHGRSPAALDLPG